MNSSPSPAEDLGLLVKETQSVLHQRMDEALRPLGLTVPQYACLLALSGEPGMTASDLARRAFVSRQSMNVLLQGMERRGLLERDADTGGRRERATRLTPAGADLAPRARQEVSAVARTMVAGLDAADLDRTLEILRACRDNLLTA